MGGGLPNVGDGRGFLVTGATGFLGKVVIDELLRREAETGPVPIVIPVRGTDAAHAQARFRREIAGSPALAAHDPAWIDRVTVLRADLTLHRGGLDSSLIESLQSRVGHVMHCAASVEFTLPVAEAAAANIHAALHTQGLAHDLGAAMTSVSTAYVTPHREPRGCLVVEEALAQLPRSAREILEEIDAGDVDESALLAVTGHPNTYTLTKCLAEHLLAEECGREPLTLVRPSIISASRLTPEPGWIDSTAAFAAFVLLLGSGNLSAVRADLDSHLDIVPVDDVARRVVDCALDPPRDGRPRIRHATAGRGLSCNVGESYETINDFFARYPVMGGPRRGYVGDSRARFFVSDLVRHRMRTTAGVALARVQRNARGERSARKLAERQGMMNAVFPYFTHKTFDFRSSVPLHRGFVAQDYVALVCSGVHRHLMRQDPQSVAIAGRRHDRRGNAVTWARRLGSQTGPATPRGQRWLVRLCAAALSTLFDRCAGSVRFDRPSFERALAACGDDVLPIVLPSHRSYLDFLVVPFLFYSHPELGLAIPRIAADRQFAKIPVLGRIAGAAGAFFLDRGKGKEDKALTKAVHDLVAEHQNVLVFIEGARSRTRAYLPPHRGLLRSLQSTGARFVALPISIDYDRVAEEGTFEDELAGVDPDGIQLRKLARWLVQVLRGEIDIGEIHIACGEPLPLDLGTDVSEFADRVIEELHGSSVTSEFQLRCFLEAHPQLDIDVARMRAAIEARGGRVVESKLERTDGQPLGEQTEIALRSQWMHHFFADALAHFEATPASCEPIRHYIARHAQGRTIEPRPVNDPLLGAMLDCAFSEVIATYRELGELARSTDASAGLDPKAVLAARPGLHRPYVMTALEAG